MGYCKEVKHEELLLTAALVDFNVSTQQADIAGRYSCRSAPSLCVCIVLLRSTLTNKLAHACRLRKVLSILVSGFVSLGLFAANRHTDNHSSTQVMLS